MRREKYLELKSYIEELKAISIEEKHDNPTFISSIPYSITLNNGRTIEREKIMKGNNNGSAVIIMPITLENEILTVIEPRVFTEKKVSVSFPAGYIEKGENPYMAALRELKEETGYVPKHLKLLDQFYQDEGCSEAFNHSFIAFDSVCKHPQQLDSEENIKFMTFNLFELEELERNGYINSANSKLTLEKGKKYIKRRMR